MTAAAVPAELDPDDVTLLTLARGARARAAAAEGSAVRDTDGRTYAGATVALTSLRLTALQAAVATAVASGAAGLEAAVIVGVATTPDADSLAVAVEFGAGYLLLAGSDGMVQRRIDL